MYRQRAQEQRAAAGKAMLQNVRARALHAAERWDLMADQLELSSAATVKRDAEKAARDAARTTQG
jgi:uncharacterized protein involved in exopolysaccharide biosynthesis